MCKETNWPASVSAFTRAAALKPLPEEPTPLNRERVLWLTRMVVSELYEFACTVSEPDEKETQQQKAEALMQEAFQSYDKNGDPFSSEPIVQAAQQADAMVDWIYYTLNVAGAHRIDLDPVFQLVHEANMQKIDSATGIVRRNEDGKIQKPPGWTPPDIESELKRQLEECRESNKRQKL